MTTENDPIKSIQSRIDELEHTISERGEKIKERTLQLKEDLQDELSPMELIKKNPVEATGISFVSGIVAGRVIRSLFSTKRQPAAKTSPATPQNSQASQPSPVAVAAGAIGVEMLHVVKDLAVTWLKSRVQEKKSKV